MIIVIRLKFTRNFLAIDESLENCLFYISKYKLTCFKKKFLTSQLSLLSCYLVVDFIKYSLFI